MPASSEPATASWRQRSSQQSQISFSKGKMETIRNNLLANLHPEAQLVSWPVSFEIERRRGRPAERYFHLPVDHQEL